MIGRILSTARIEFAIALRNRWMAIAVGMMALFSLVLSMAGSAPTGDLGVDRLSVTVASLTSLSVYLVPLIALLISFDAVAGEVERVDLMARFCEVGEGAVEANRCAADEGDEHRIGAAVLDLGEVGIEVVGGEREVLLADNLTAAGGAGFRGRRRGLCGRRC